MRCAQYPFWGAGGGGFIEAIYFHSGVEQGLLHSCPVEQIGQQISLIYCGSEERNVEFRHGFRELNKFK